MRTISGRRDQKHTSRLRRIYQATFAGILLWGFGDGADAQTLVSLKHQSANGVGIGFLLTDGRVLFQDATYLGEWVTLTPDNFGRYQTGTWQQVGRLPNGYIPDAFASAELADGRVVIAGGEYNGPNADFALTNLCAIFDPLTNAWKPLAPPPNWKYIGDSPSVVLPNGKFLIGNKLDKRLALLDPKTLTWTEPKSTGKKDFNAEEGWTLMPDGTVLTYDVKAAPHAERYDLATQAWTSLGSTIANLQGPPDVASISYGPGLVYDPPGEVGPGILRPDGTVFATGALHNGATAGHTAIYTPGPNGAAGTWKAGPDFPNQDDAADNFAALLPNGDVIVEGENGAIYEFDGTNFTDTGLNGQDGSLIALPTGEILVNGSALFRETGKPDPAWAPTIIKAPAKLTRGSSYTISGRQFNGLSQAAAFGDEYQTATNYPLVRITNQASKHVVFARSHDHSTMGVATGKALVSTHFDVPAGTETGAASLEVVANGIASAPVTVTVD